MTHRPGYLHLKRRALEFGRDPGHVKILPGIVPIIGATEAEAREREAELNRLIRPEYALPQLAELIGLVVNLARRPEEQEHGAPAHRGPEVPEHDSALVPPSPAVTRATRGRVCSVRPAPSRGHHRPLSPHGR